MYDAQIIREQWNKKFSTAAKAFIIVSGLYVLIFIGVGFAMNKISDSAPHVLERMIGLSAVLGGMVLFVGTGLIKKWRWAAIVATLWCLTLIVGPIVAVVAPGSSPSESSEHSAAYEGGEAVGAACPGILTLIMLIACGRAALAKRPRDEEVSSDVDHYSRTEFDQSNPYGFVATAAPRKQPTRAYIVIAVGAFLTVGGAALFAKAIFEERQAAEIVPEDWQLYQGEGFLIEFPGAPERKMNVVPNMAFSEVLELQAQHHAFEVVHYRPPAGMYLREGGLQEEVSGVISRSYGRSEFAGTRSIHDTRIREPFRARKGERIGIVLGVLDGDDVYLIIVQAQDERGRAVCERFVNSFRLAAD